MSTKSLEKLENRYTLRGRIITDTGLHIGSGRTTAVVGSDSPVMRDARGRPYIPGSSLKGAFRAYLEKLVRSLPGGDERGSRLWACNPLEMKSGGSCVDNDRYRALQAEAQKSVNADEKLTSGLLEETCNLCRLFGSPWVAARVRVADSYLDEEFFWSGHLEVRDGVGIDRDTETAADNVKYDFETVPAGVPFEVEIEVENVEDWELGLIFLGLREMENRRVSLGGITSRGLGRVEWSWSGIEEVNAADREGFLDYLRSGKGRLYRPAVEIETVGETATEPAEGQEPPEEELTPQMIMEILKNVVSELNKQFSEEFNKEGKRKKTSQSMIGSKLPEAGVPKEKYKIVPGCEKLSDIIKLALKYRIIIGEEDDYRPGDGVYPEPGSTGEQVQVGEEPLRKPVEEETEPVEAGDLGEFVRGKIDALLHYLKGGE